MKKSFSDKLEIIFKNFKNKKLDKIFKLINIFSKCLEDKSIYKIEFVFGCGETKIKIGETDIIRFTYKLGKNPYPVIINSYDKDYVCNNINEIEDNIILAINNHKTLFMFLK